jgi:DNA-directed RNA polymerase subunit RPC12/RpoP
MKKEIKCSSCNTDVVMIENKMFFSEEKKLSAIICPYCNSKITEEYTDGWFFVQTKKEYSFQLRIDSQKEEIKFNGVL